MTISDRLRETLRYDFDSGAFFWRISRWKTKIGRRAGTVNVLGYRQVRVDGRFYYEHRLAWLYVYGRWPDGNLDHVNGNREDNRISNLRIANSSQNTANSKISKTNTSGYKGVSFDRDKGRWHAYITHNYKRINLGLFDDPESAHDAYKSAAEQHFGEFARFE